MPGVCARKEMIYVTSEGAAYHQAVVCLGANDAADALRSLADGVKGQVVALLYLERFPQVLQPRPVEQSPPRHSHKGVVAGSLQLA
jgi:hypothetical protein